MTLGQASMRPRLLAAGFQFPRPGNISRAAKSGCAAEARRETESAMPLEASSLTKWRRVVRKILGFLGQAETPDYSQQTPYKPRQ